MKSPKPSARRIGILAYGSLIEDPGFEIEPHIVEKVAGVETPFRIEFVRTSPIRGGGPTVVPVEIGGASVFGMVFVLHERISRKNALDLLWRRETRNEGTTLGYEKPTRPDPNRMLAVELSNFAGLGVVLYARFGATLTDPTPDKLADLAIRSVDTEAGKRGRDGISYLMSLKRKGIVTPLMGAYEQAILKRTSAASLEDALAGLRQNAAR